MRERPLVYLVPPMAAALYAAVCLELPVQLHIIAPIALLLVLAAVFLRRRKCLLNGFAVLAPMIASPAKGMILLIIVDLTQGKERTAFVTGGVIHLEALRTQRLFLIPCVLVRPEPLSASPTQACPILQAGRTEQLSLKDFQVFLCSAAYAAASFFVHRDTSSLILGMFLCSDPVGVTSGSFFRRIIYDRKERP